MSDWFAIDSIPSKLRSWESQFDWTQHTAEIVDPSGNVAFQQKNVEFPKDWDPNSINICAQKFFGYNKQHNTKEFSLRQMIHRVVGTIFIDWGANPTKKFEEIVDRYCDEYNQLASLIANQQFSFNSPVWFNVGNTSRPQTSACFILSVEDSMDSIIENLQTEMKIFKFGSGAGSNRSPLRSEKESLSGGGKASGPMSFIRTYDGAAGAVKSGGKTRRAAKMEILDHDHLDIKKFITFKREEERKARILIAGGIDGSFCGEAYTTVSGQNANYSVRVTDNFMRAVAHGEPVKLRGRHDDIVESVSAAELFSLIAECAWECADPGMQFDGAIQEWNTCKTSGRINATNPCSEYVFLDDTSCNLGSHNLTKYYNREKNCFEIEKFIEAVRLSVRAMDILIDQSSFPTAKIGRTTKQYRTLGVGFTGLGSLLMELELPYDSRAACAMAGAITSLMTAAAYYESQQRAWSHGSFPAYHKNAKSVQEIIEKHADKTRQLPHIHDSDIYDRIREHAVSMWSQVKSTEPTRNAQLTVLAPTGTISFLMGSQASTGIEPLLGLVTYKNLAGGGVLKQIHPAVKTVLNRMAQRHFDADQTEILMKEYAARLETTGSFQFDKPVDGIPNNKVAELYAPVFETAFADPVTEKSLRWEAHVNMMAACQPFLSGAISKTVNLPESATVEDIKAVFFEAWLKDLKCIAVYRDNSKGTQAVSTKKQQIPEQSKSKDAEPVAPASNLNQLHWGARLCVPQMRPSITTEVKISDGSITTKGYLTIGLSDMTEKRPVEVFMTFDKVGGVVQGMVHALCKSLSYNLQLGINVQDLAMAFVNTRFEPAGATTTQDIRVCTSIVDYIARFLLLTFVPDKLAEISGRPLNTNPLKIMCDSAEALSEMGGTDQNKGTTSREVTAKPVPAISTEVHSSGKICGECGSETIRVGACEMCQTCGTTNGCS